MQGKKGVRIQMQENGNLLRIKPTKIKNPQGGRTQEVKIKQ